MSLFWNGNEVVVDRLPYQPQETLNPELFVLDHRDDTGHWWGLYTTPKRDSLIRSEPKLRVNADDSSDDGENPTVFSEELDVMKDHPPQVQPTGETTELTVSGVVDCLFHSMISDDPLESLLILAPSDGEKSCRLGAMPTKRLAGAAGATVILKYTDGKGVKELGRTICDEKGRYSMTLTVDKAYYDFHAKQYFIEAFYTASEPAYFNFIHFHPNMLFSLKDRAACANSTLFARSEFDDSATWPIL